MDAKFNLNQYASRSTATMGTQSAPTPWGPHVIVQDNDVRFYTTFELGNGISAPNINDNLESILAHYLFFSEISKPEYELARECYDGIISRNFLVNENDRQTLARRSKLIIRLISRKTIVEADDDIHLLEYGHGSLRKCVYILYDEGTKLYAPLYVVDQGLNRLLTIFQRDDPTIVQLFDDYVRNVRAGKKIS